MHNFQRGDWVALIYDYHGIPAGSRGIVRYIGLDLEDGEFDLILVEFENGIRENVFQSRLAKV